MEDKGKANIEGMTATGRRHESVHLDKESIVAALEEDDRIVDNISLIESIIKRGESANNSDEGETENKEEQPPIEGHHHMSSLTARRLSRAMTQGSDAGYSDDGFEDDEDDSDHGDEKWYY
eukprot:CAMPEP_0182438184 /NCGR_PEP_ID=MMETSP1167-20130531/85575_1 /TAXON_ID=2988 /ORGANISM="Mallomonas Sp, Strain CCMP3275" /LENGTH=120 /DNA_ID=CAMNT_0024631413 /DNA_START=933 /DNA_END=1295 /DNA_ORIENTATION=-